MLNHHFRRRRLFNPQPRPTQFPFFGRSPHSKDTWPLKNEGRKHDDRLKRKNPVLRHHIICGHAYSGRQLRIVQCPFNENLFVLQEPHCKLRKWPVGWRKDIHRQAKL